MKFNAMLCDLICQLWYSAAVLILLTSFGFIVACDCFCDMTFVKLEKAR